MTMSSVMIVILPALLLQRNYKERSALCIPYLQRETIPPRATTSPAATVTTSPPRLPPLVLLPTTPSHTDKDSSAESSDISNAIPQRLRRARTRSGRVRQATGRKICTRGSGCGHVRGGGTVERRGSPGAAWDSLKQPKTRFPFTFIPGVHIQSDDATSACRDDDE